METLIPDMLRWRFVLPVAQRETYTNKSRTMWLILDVCLADSRQTYRYNAVAIKKTEGEGRWGLGVNGGPLVKQRNVSNPVVRNIQNAS